MAHAGSWFGLPDFGITEMFSGNNRTAQGGSNLFGTQSNAQTPPSTQTPPPDFGPSGVWNQGDTMGAAVSTGQPTNPFTGTKMGGSGGQVLGSQTQQTQQGSPVVDTIRDQDRDLQNRLSDFIGSLGGQQSQLEGIARQSANDQKAGINASLNTALTRFPQYQQTVNQNAELGLRDLAQRGQSYKMAANNRLGLSGAGDSSGAMMYDYALGKAQSRMESDVYRDRNNQLAEIQMVEEETRRKAEEEINGVDQWLGSQVNAITQQIQGLSNQLRGQSLQVRKETYDNMMRYLQDMESKANDYKLMLTQNVQNRLQSLNDAKMQIANTANFDPRSIVAGEINAMPGAMQQAEMNFVNPFTVRDEDRRLF